MLKHSSFPGNADSAVCQIFSLQSNSFDVVPLCTNIGTTTTVAVVHQWRYLAPKKKKKKKMKSCTVPPWVKWKGREGMQWDRLYGEILTEMVCRNGVAHEILSSSVACFCTKKSRSEYVNEERWTTMSDGKEVIGTKLTCEETVWFNWLILFCFRSQKHDPAKLHEVMTKTYDFSVFSITTDCLQK